MPGWLVGIALVSLFIGACLVYEIISKRDK